MREALGWFVRCAVSQEETDLSPTATRTSANIPAEQARGPSPRTSRKEHRRRHPGSGAVQPHPTPELRDCEIINVCVQATVRGGLSRRPQEAVQTDGHAPGREKKLTLSWHRLEEARCVCKVPGGTDLGTESRVRWGDEDECGTQERAWARFTVS